MGFALTMYIGGGKRPIQRHCLTDWRTLVPKVKSVLGIWGCLEGVAVGGAEISRQPTRLPELFPLPSLRET